MTADVVPAYTMDSMQEVVDSNIEKMKKEGKLKDGDAVVIVQGEHAGTPGSTNTMRLIKA